MSSDWKKILEVTAPEIARALGSQDDVKARHFLGDVLLAKKEATIEEIASAISSIGEEKLRKLFQEKKREFDEEFYRSRENSNSSLGISRNLLGFLDRNLNRFSRTTQDIIGLTILFLLVIVVINIFVADTHVKGKLLIKASENETKEQADEYLVETGNQQFVTNQFGNWILPIRGGLPRPITIYVKYPSGKTIGDFTIWAPWPILDAMRTSNLKVIVHTYREEEKRFDVSEMGTVEPFHRFVSAFVPVSEVYAQSYGGLEFWQILPIEVHLEGIGDVFCNNGIWCGTKGESRRLEAFSIFVEADKKIHGRLRYMCHLEGIGDTDWMYDGDMCGTKGQSRRLEGFAIKIEGPGESRFVIKYQAHLQNLGDTRVYSDGQFAGTRGESRRVEAIKVWLERRH